MSTLFWLILATLLLLAIAILIIPLLRPQLSVQAREQRNLPIVRQQLIELKQQLNDGLLSQSQFDSYQQELMLNLQTDLQSADATIPSTAGRWAIPVLALAVPILSLSLYLQFGDPDAMKQAEEQQQNQQTQVNFKALIPDLIARLKQNPDDLKGWFMLWRTYIYIEDYQHAEEVFAKLYQFQPNNVEVIINYANSMAMNNNSQLAGEPTALIEKALKLAPDDSNVLWLAGLAKADAGEVDAARSYWLKLLQQLPADASGRQQVEQLLSELDSQGNNNAKPAEAAVNSIQIPVQVSIADNLKAHAENGQTVFIYAQAITGPKMPLAIVRKQVADLPISVNLNDSMAMQPGLHLADFKELRILARVSKSGNAMSQPGDLVGSVEINPSENMSAVAIIINQEIQ